MTLSKIFFFIVFSVYFTNNLYSQERGRRGDLGIEISSEIKNWEEGIDSNQVVLKVSISGIFHRSPRHLSQFDFLNVVWVKNDPYNSRKTNFSIFPVINLFLFIKADSTMFNYPSMNIYSFLLNSFNSSHHFLLNKPKYNDERSFLGGKTAFFFIKNNTDFFLFRKRKWVRFSPGIGMGLMSNGNMLKIGMYEDISYDLDKLNTQLSLHLSFTLGSIMATMK